MTPYNNGSRAIIDPLLKKEKELFFGEVPLALWNKEGKVINQKYVHNKKFVSYELEFEGEEQTYWFAEAEIVVFYQN